MAYELYCYRSDESVIELLRGDPAENMTIDLNRELLPFMHTLSWDASDPVRPVFAWQADGAFDAHASFGLRFNTTQESSWNIFGHGDTASPIRAPALPDEMAYLRPTGLWSPEESVLVAVIDDGGQAGYQPLEPSLVYSDNMAANPGGADIRSSFTGANIVEFWFGDDQE
jgi:hypothetical protein